MPQPQPQKRMSQKEFLDQVRKQVPELKDFSDIVLMNEILKRRPDLRDQVDNPLAGDAEAAKAQTRAQARSRSLVDPQYWKDHPNIARFTKGVLDTMPAGGSMIGGAPGALSFLASPFDAGVNIPASAAMTATGAALGAGAGRGLRDLSAQVLGLEQSSPFDKAKNIVLDTGIAAVTPGLVEAVKSPIQTARWAVRDYGKIFPQRLQSWLEPQFLQDFAAGPKPKPVGPVMPDFAPEPPPVPVKDAMPVKEGIFTETPRKALPPSSVDFYHPESMGSTEPFTGSTSSGPTPAGNAPPTNAAPNPTPNTGSTSQPATSGNIKHATDVGKHVVLTKTAVSNVGQHLKPGTKILVKAKDATPDVVREALDSGYTFDGLNDEGHFRFTKVGE